MTLASTPSITFSVPAVSVTPSTSNTSTHGSSTAGRNSLDQLHPHGGAAAGQLSPLPLPRPPRCLTPYPDTSSFPHSLEPSPLSSPAFSINVGSSGDEETSGSEAEDDTDVGTEVEPEANKTEAKPITSPKPTDHARLLAPALQMSHLNSPTDVLFRQLPLSPMRKLKAGSATPSPLASPLSPTLPVQVDEDEAEEKSKKRPEPITLSLKRRATSTPRDKVSFNITPTSIPTATAQSDSPSDNRTAVPRTSKRVGKSGTELQVHVETVD